ncbi:MAG: dihydroorotate dehydrogenase (quinone) [Gemmatimonadales bacterium]
MRCSRYRRSASTPWCSPGFAALPGRRCCAAAPSTCWRPIRCWRARCSGSGSRARWGWPPDSTRTAAACTPGVRWGSATRRSAPSPHGPSPAIRSPGCSGCPRTARCSTGWASTTTAPASWPLRLSRHSGGVPIGVNIGKTKITAPEDAVDDYRASARLLGPLAGYLVVNVSSPNTPGLRDLQAVESLRPILAGVLAETSTPVLVKIAPDLSDSDVDEIADLAVELGLAGIVATNTTISRAGLRTPGVDALGSGGVSGPPVARRSLEILRRLHARVGDRLVLISVGGIETADDAWERIVSGASLLQGYTGFIYGGGLWAKHIHDGIAQRLRAGGFPSLREAVGSAAR